MAFEDPPTSGQNIRGFIAPRTGPALPCTRAKARLPAWPDIARYGHRRPECPRKARAHLHHMPTARRTTPRAAASVAAPAPAQLPGLRRDWRSQPLPEGRLLQALRRRRLGLGRSRRLYRAHGGLTA